MVNLKNSILTWSDITYPLFPLSTGIEGFYEEDGVVLVKDCTGYRIIDDTNLEGNTLGIRRIKLKADKKQIYPLTRKIDTFIDLIKYSNVYKHYIDHTGKYFKYEKTRFAKLVYKPINFRKFVDGKGTVFTVKGVNSWFEVPYVVSPEVAWVGLLKIDRSWLMYELSFTKQPDTRRKI